MLNPILEFICTREQQIDTEIIFSDHIVSTLTAVFRYSKQLFLCLSFFIHKPTYNNNTTITTITTSMLLSNKAGAAAAAVKTILYSAYFCPYAQRVWMALNELNDDNTNNNNNNIIDFELVEALHIDPHTEAYQKDPDLLRFNPKGLVPTLVQFSSQTTTTTTTATTMTTTSAIKEDSTTTTTDRSRSSSSSSDGSINIQVYTDSIPLLGEIFALRYDSDNDDQQQQHVVQKEWCQQEAMQWDQKLCSPFYQVLLQQDAAASQSAWQKMKTALQEFCQYLSYNNSSSSSNGDRHQISFYNHVQDKPGLIDFCVFPFVHRLYILQHYKGFSLDDNDGDISDDNNNNDDRHQQCRRTNTKAMLAAWQHRMEALPSVAATLCPKERLIPIYARYADGTAKSKVADSVRSGNQAHDV